MAEEEDRFLYEENVKIDANLLVRAKVPPAPIICSRTHNQIVVQPKNFESTDNIKPYWYTSNYIYTDKF